MARLLTSLLVILGASFGVVCGCQDDASKVDPQSCYDQCDSQTRTQGCSPIVGNADCKSLCDALVSSVHESCDGEFQSYYRCSAELGFSCLGELQVQKDSTCEDERIAFDRCNNGGEATTCKVGTANGHCPQIACKCPEGVKSVNGFETTGDGCVCLTETTCQDLFCD